MRHTFTHKRCQETDCARQIICLRRVRQSSKLNVQHRQAGAFVLSALLEHITSSNECTAAHSLGFYSSPQAAHAVEGSLCVHLLQQR
jgi:hypothetical protein